MNPERRGHDQIMGEYIFSSGAVEREENTAHPQRGQSVPLEQAAILPQPERAALNEEESRLLPELRQKIRAKTHEIILSMVPLADKREYLKANELVPHLVQEETDALVFVRVCDYNIWEAAARICLYWKERESLFGPGRAFLPLDMTGKGALSDQDVLSLQAGFPAMLPNSSQGHPIVFLDRRQHMPFLDSKARRRCIFYLAKKLAESEAAQVEGIHLLVMVTMPRMPTFGLNEDNIRRGYYLATKVLPIKIKKIHALNSPPTSLSKQNGDILIQKTAKMYFLQSMITSYIQCILDRAVPSYKLNICFEREKGYIALELQDELGLDKDGIPEFLGGNWTFERFGLWCREQIRLEQNGYSKMSAPPRPPDDSTDHAAASEPIESLQKGSSESKRRAMNIIYSRQKRARRRQEAEALQEEHKKSVVENVRLKEENIQLELLWKRAKESVGQQKTTSVEQEECFQESDNSDQESREAENDQKEDKKLPAKKL